MDLIYGTFNNAKLESMRTLLNSINIRISGLSELNLDINSAIEDFDDPLENAISKAKTYFEKLQKPLFSCDSALYFSNVDPKDQPGVFVKRIKGKSLSNRDMVKYYSNLADKYGGTLTAYYKNAIALIYSSNREYFYSGQDIWSEKFYIVSRPHNKFIDGFPLDSLSVDIKSGKYYYDLNKEKLNLDVDKGFIDFFKRVMIS